MLQMLGLTPTEPPAPIQPTIPVPAPVMANTNNGGPAPVIANPNNAGPAPVIINPNNAATPAVPTNKVPTRITPQPTTIPPAVLQMLGLVQPTEPPVLSAPPPTPEDMTPSPAASKLDDNNPANNAPVPVTECSEGTWYHTQPMFSGYHKCVTSSECRQRNEAECCLTKFCYCGVVGGNGSGECVSV